MIAALLPAGVLLAAPALPSAEAALEAAAACYEAIDYDCAALRLAEALAGGLPPHALVRARHYEALIALAHRDEPRARAAVRALLALEPGFDPGPRSPPALLALVEAERPDPPPRLAPRARADATTYRLAGQDADRWTEGLGLEAGLGVVVDGWLGLELAGGYSDHRPRTFVLEGLALTTLTAGAFVPLRTGAVVVSPGLSLGAAHVSVDGVTGDRRYWGLLVQVPVDLSWLAWRGLGLGVRVAPSLLAVSDADRTAFSFLLPLMGGLRYAY